jgi:hypothetical protein
VVQFSVFSQRGFQPGLKSCRITGGNVGLAGWGNLLVRDHHVQRDTPLLHAGDQVFEGAVHGGLAERVLVGVAVPGHAEAPTVEIGAALPRAAAGVPAAVGVVGEDCPAAVAGYEDVVAHLTRGVGDPSAAAPVAAVRMMQDNGLRLDAVGLFVRRAESAFVVARQRWLDGEARPGCGDITRRDRRWGSVGFLAKDSLDPGPHGLFRVAFGRGIDRDRGLLLEEVVADGDAAGHRQGDEREG